MDIHLTTDVIIEEWKKKGKMLGWTGERYLPFVHSEIYGRRYTMRTCIGINLRHIYKRTF